MINQAKASQLAKAGFDLWQEGRLDEALTKYREALECADPSHYALAGYHTEFAAVLAKLGWNAEARQQYELALTGSLRQDPSGRGPGVLIARYFLSEHLLMKWAIRVDELNPYRLTTAFSDRHDVCAQLA